MSSNEREVEGDEKERWKDNWRNRKRKSCRNNAVEANQNGCNIWLLNTLELKRVNNRKYKKSIFLCSKSIILCKIKHHNAAKKELDGRC